MAMAVSNNGAFALTVSADHLIGRYDLLVGGVILCLRRRFNFCLAG